MSDASKSSTSKGSGDAKDGVPPQQATGGDGKPAKNDGGKK